MEFISLFPRPSSHLEGGNCRQLPDATRSTLMWGSSVGDLHMGDCNIARRQPFGFIVLRDDDCFLLFIPRYDWYPYQSDVESFSRLNGTARRDDSKQILFELGRIRRIEPAISPLIVSTCGGAIAEMRPAGRGILVATRGVLRFIHSFLDLRSAPILIAFGVSVEVFLGRA